MADLSDRQTGRTTNQLLHCLAAASAGERVVFVVNSRQLVDYCLRLPIVREFPGIVVRQSKQRIEIPNAGWVDVATAACPDRLRGMGAHVEVDHAVTPEIGIDLFRAIASGALSALGPGI